MDRHNVGRLPFWASLFASAVAWSIATCPVASAAEKPNVLLIVADDLGYADLGFQGSKDVRTPHIDSIAAAGVRFTNGYVSCPVCSPSRAGLMTGRYGVRFGIEANPGFSHAIGLPPTEKTLPEHLKAAGYAAGMFGKWHLGFRPAMRPNARGFDEFYGFLGGAHSYVAAGGDRDPDNDLLRNREKVPSIDYLTDALSREAADFIQRNRDRPWFVYLPLNAPHGPFQAPEKYASRFPEIKDDTRRTLVGMISAMDDAVGAVLSKLRELKLEERTLIFFLSDNGAPNHPQSSASNQPLRGYKAQLLEGGIRVPFLIQWKGRLPAGKVDQRPVIALDVMTTALAAAEIARPEGDAPLDGVNLLPYLSGQQAGPPHDALFWRYVGQRAVRMGDWKLLHKGKKTQLFNLSTDPSEANDLAAEEPEKVKTLEAAWRNWNADNKKNKAKDESDTEQPAP